MSAGYRDALKAIKDALDLPYAAVTIPDPTIEGEQ